MIRFAWLLFLFVFQAQAGERVSLVFDQISVVDLARVVFQEIANEPVMFTHEAVESAQTVSVSLRDYDRSQSIVQVSDLLRKSGLDVENRGGVVWIGKHLEDDEDFFYRPKYRRVGYLVDLLSPVFKPGSFSIQRGINQNNYSNSNNVAGIQTTSNTVAQPVPPVDTGSSAYSLLDKNSDSFVFRGDKNALERLKRLLGQIDTPVPELLVKAVVFEVSTGKADKSALSLAMSILGGKFSASLGNAVPGDFSAVVKLSNLDAVVDALSTDNRFKVVSAPQLRVKSGEKARLTVGTETPILGTAQVDRNGNPVQSVEYRPSGVILDLAPQVHEDVADLTVVQQISNFVATTTGVNNSPTLIKRELSTTVGVADDDVLVLGGLDEEKQSEDHTGLPWLPAWFGSNGKTHSKTEVLLILKASRI